MNQVELNEFLEQHQNIEWGEEETGQALLFRNENLPWYQEDKNRATRVTIEKLSQLTHSELYDAINKGLDVDHITRVTGYFSKIKGWNNGKLGELKDRKREREL